MLTDKITENKLILRELLGLNDSDAELLNASVDIILPEGSNSNARLLASLIHSMLGQTIENVAITGECRKFDLAIVIGGKPIMSGGGLVCVSTTHDLIKITEGLHEGDISEKSPEILLYLAACYACSVAIRCLVGDKFKIKHDPIIAFSFQEIFGIEALALKTPFQIGQKFLGGTGAIGTRFLDALRYTGACGKIEAFDDDTVSDGNRNRCSFFTSDDVGSFKVDAVAASFKNVNSSIEIIPHRKRIEEHLNAHWEEIEDVTIISTVDSKRVRRTIQGIFPDRVFDASTTGIQEIIFHKNSLDAELACMGCVYAESPDENAHKVHVAESLGLPISALDKDKVDEEDAKAICSKHPQLKLQEIIGQPVDSVFKAAVCSGTEVKAENGKRVVAPFGFVSALAGAVLAIEFSKSFLHASEQNFNVWRISPWCNPRPEMKRLERARKSLCHIHSYSELMLEILKRVAGKKAAAKEKERILQDTEISAAS